MYLLWFITIATLALWHLQLTHCDDLTIHTSQTSHTGGLAGGGGGVGGGGGGGGQGLSGNTLNSGSSTMSGILMNHNNNNNNNNNNNGLVNPSTSNINQLNVNNSLLTTLMNGNANSHLNGLSAGIGSLGAVGSKGLMGHASGGAGTSTHGVGHHHGHALAGLAGLGIVVPGHRLTGGTNTDNGGRYNPGGYLSGSSMDLMGVGGVGGGMQSNLALGGGLGGGSSGSQYYSCSNEGLDMRVMIPPLK
uniref:Uncharacterized protein n=1 Tax=Glossina pallidipes TaxID=7398 RepID=A0A1A9Z610_GLOPL